MSLYHKYRPEDFDQVKGNKELILTLQGMLADKETCAHVFLFHGPSGCGKTTLGRILAKQLGCAGSDYQEVDSGAFHGVETVREIRNNAQYLPIQSSCRTWLLDECHKYKDDSQNALLKILEDTPKHVYFILCTTDPQKLLTAIKSRCQIFQVKPLQEDEMFSLFRYIIRKEKKEMPAEEVMDQILQDSMGRPREGINILEKVLAVPTDVQLAVAQKAAEEEIEAIELCRAIIKKASWKTVAAILNRLSDQEPESIRRMILGYCQSILLKESNDMAALIIESFWEPLYDIGRPGLVFCCYNALK